MLNRINQEILNLLDGEEIARSVYYFPHSELRPAWGIIFCGMHFRYSGFHSIKNWGTSCSFSDIAQKKTKLAPLQEKEKALIMTMTVDAFCKLVKNQADVAQLITKMVLTLVQIYYMQWRSLFLYLQQLSDYPLPFWLALFVEGIRFTQAKLLAAQEYATSTGLLVPRNFLIPRIKVLVLGQPGEEVFESFLGAHAL
ncbi:uncharacterized protein LOC116004179 isoform X2 [Ipomoea triloba]|uniref:uncharacterized protein LOC116004179 isoform X2 n=1 Tax=Ipomoea triloba TaxID=35885 RepID=UPI00125E4DBA|nr:uncharacterized protein LOC116004179 isoform X2 [Ipomoea triloba]